jgi:hypothetical protein
MDRVYFKVTKTKRKSRPPVINSPIVEKEKEKEELVSHDQTF